MPPSDTGSELAAEPPTLRVVPERQGAMNWDSVPRRIVTLWVPLFTFVLLFIRTA